MSNCKRIFYFCFQSDISIKKIKIRSSFLVIRKSICYIFAPNKIIKTQKSGGLISNVTNKYFVA